jgi:hypothetical protein
MDFEQIKAITEKYGPVLEQLDRLRTTYALGSSEYFSALDKMKLAVSDQFEKEVNELKVQTLPQELPTEETNGVV